LHPWPLSVIIVSEELTHGIMPDLAQQVEKSMANVFFGNCSREQTVA